MKDSIEILLMLWIFISIFFWNKTFIFSVIDGIYFQSHLQDKGSRLECLSKLTNTFSARYKYYQHWHFHVLSFFHVDLTDPWMTRVNKVPWYHMMYLQMCAIPSLSFQISSDSNIHFCFCVYFCVLCFVWSCVFCVMYVVCMFCLIVVPLPPGENAFAVKINIYLHFLFFI
jgi:hypothetical protein